MAAGAAVDERPVVVPPDSWTAAIAACPKHMTSGPCAGLLDDGACEVPDAGRCSYLAVPDADWPYRETTAPASHEYPFLDLATRRAVVVTDLPVGRLPPGNPPSVPLLEAAEALRGASDALLLGDHGGARLQLPPSYRAKVLIDAGHPVWAGINCRDRNRVALEAELAACADAGVTGVHCVTGAHTVSGDRPEAQPVFDLDCVELLERAETFGLLASAAHAPSVPPAQQRVPRLLAKARAGARVVFVDHCGGADAVTDAVSALHTSGYGGLVIACVPVVTDAESAAIIESFAASRLPAGYVRGILAAPDPARAGVAAAVELSRQMLAIPGVGGVNLSGGGAPGHEVAHARLLAEIGTEVLG